jgi:hypothetical protein
MPAYNVPIFPAGDAAILSASDGSASLLSMHKIRLGCLMCWRTRILGISYDPENADVTAILGGLFPIMAAPSEASFKQLRESYIRVVKPS